MDHPAAVRPPLTSHPTATSHTTTTSPHQRQPTASSASTLPAPARHFIATGSIQLTPTVGATQDTPPTNRTPTTARGPIAYPLHPHGTRAILERAFLHAATLYPDSAHHLVRLIQIANPPHLVPTFRAALFVTGETDLVRMRLVVLGQGAGTPDEAVATLAERVEEARREGGGGVF